MLSGSLAVLVLALGVQSCRENPPVSPQSPTQSLQPGWTVGDRMVYDTWALDTLGLQIPTSRCVSARTVILNGQNFQGRSDVVVMVDSVDIPGIPPRIDTVYLSQTPSGDLWQYGYLASLGKRYGEFTSSTEWDLIAPLSGTSASWTVGYADTSGSVDGTMDLDTRYFSVAIDGVNYVYTAERVDFFGQNIGVTFWVSTSPPVFPAFIESASPTVRGVYRTLVSAQIASL